MGFNCEGPRTPVYIIKSFTVASDRTDIKPFKAKGHFVIFSYAIITDFLFGYANKAPSVQKTTHHSCWRSPSPKPICLFRCTSFRIKVDSTQSAS